MFYERPPYDFSAHLNNEDYSDVKVFIDDGVSDAKTFSCHKGSVL
jgi:hypothetical protein